MNRVVVPEWEHAPSGGSVPEAGAGYYNVRA